ncbi:MAG: DUF151 domain-containing protein [Bacteroidia bacterium]|nr:DUF151 domain-containing protein [Bacteroidia bacterium]
MSKVKLNVLGLSNSQSQSGAYALILSEEHGRRRLPIIIGAFEAQAIALQLEGLFPPRPLTHDLFYNFATAFKIDIAEVNIYRLEEGVFYSILICNRGNEKLKIDARTSDAVALALRFKCPIYTTEEILEKAGIFLEFDKKTEAEELTTKKTKGNKPGTEFASLSNEELNEMLTEAINNEDYERASIIRDELNHRMKK